MRFPSPNPFKPPSTFLRPPTASPQARKTGFSGMAPVPGSRSTGGTTGSCQKLALDAASGPSLLIPVQDLTSTSRSADAKSVRCREQQLVRYTVEPFWGAFGTEKPLGAQMGVLKQGTLKIISGFPFHFPSRQPKKKAPATKKWAHLKIGGCGPPPPPLAALDLLAAPLLAPRGGLSSRPISFMALKVPSTSSDSARAMGARQFGGHKLLQNQPVGSLSSACGCSLYVFFRKASQEPLGGAGWLLKWDAHTSIHPYSKNWENLFGKSGTLAK